MITPGGGGRDHLRRLDLGAMAAAVTEAAAGEQQDRDDDEEDDEHFHLPIPSWVGSRMAISCR
jgi:hypothetical protein